MNDRKTVYDTIDPAIDMYTTKTGAKILGLKQDTLKCYANRFGYGIQPGGPGTPYIFTYAELMRMRERMRPDF